MHTVHMYVLYVLFLTQDKLYFMYYEWRTLIDGYNGAIIVIIAHNDYCTDPISGVVCCNWAPIVPPQTKTIQM